MEIFELLERDKDGHMSILLAEGVIFDNGKVCVCWKIKDKPSSVVVWDTLDDFKKISLTNKKRELLFIQD